MWHLLHGFVVVDYKLTTKMVFSNIVTVLGEVNMRNMSAQVMMFHCSKTGGIERFISQSAKVSDGIVSAVGFAQFSPSQRGVNADMGGKMVSATYKILKNEIVKVFAKIKRGYGTLDKVGSIYLRVRPDAAYRVVKIKLLDMAGVEFKEAYIEGNFDVLTVEEAIAEGVKCLPQHRHFAEKVNVDRIITSNTVVAPEKAAAPKKELHNIVNADTGEVKTVVRVKKKRSIAI